jgi:dihydroneopterin aldolase
MDRITLSGMRAEGRLGATEEERELPQLVEVDVELEVDLAAASVSDDLSDTVDYEPVVEITLRTVEDGSHALMEGLAGAIARGVLETSPPVRAVTVRVRKLAVPLDADMDHAQVEIRRARA